MAWKGPTCKIKIGGFNENGWKCKKRGIKREKLYKMLSEMKKKESLERYHVWA